jgi:hypothetical protein
VEFIIASGTPSYKETRAIVKAALNVSGAVLSWHYGLKMAGCTHAGPRGRATAASLSMLSALVESAVTEIKKIAESLIRLLEQLGIIHRHGQVTPDLKLQKLRPNKVYYN